MPKYLKAGQYSIDEKDFLGRGTFGRVYRAYDHASHEWKAMKAIDLKMLENYGDQMQTIICNEITVMRKFSKQMLDRPCPYLVRHFDCFRTDSDIYIVMELCQGGTLQDYRKAYTFTEQQVRTILKQIVIGLSYLDDMKICHRDLKPENIYIMNQQIDGREEVVFKIGDFGFAAQKQTFNQVLGTYPYMAPEIFRKENYTSKVDVWSVGIIAYQLLFKELYFFGKNKWEIEKQVKEKPFVLSQKLKEIISKEMHEFLTMCLQKDQEKRSTAATLLSLPLFNQNESKEGNDVFEAIECELQYCQFLREMAQQMCEYGQRRQRCTQFIQIYFLKKAYSIINLVSYSLMNKQNYINLEQKSFKYLLLPNNSKELDELNNKLEKQYVLVSNIFKSKYGDFLTFISKFDEKQQKIIKQVVACDEIYKDIREDIYKSELSKWEKVLQMEKDYSVLKAKLDKLLSF